MFYLATPIGDPNVAVWQPDPEAMKGNAGLADRLEQEGIEIFLPQRDADQNAPMRELLETELEVIRSCKGLILVCANTRGIYLEAGYAKAFDKPVIALRVPNTREFGEWVEGFFEYIAEDPDDLIRYLKQRAS